MVLPSPNDRLAPLVVMLLLTMTTPEPSFSVSAISEMWPLLVVVVSAPLRVISPVDFRSIAPVALTPLELTAKDLVFEKLSELRLLA